MLLLFHQCSTTQTNSHLEVTLHEQQTLLAVALWLVLPMLDLACLFASSWELCIYFITNGLTMKSFCFLMLLFFSGEMLENKPGTVSKEAVVHVLCPNISTEQTRTSYVVSSERPIQCATPEHFFPLFWLCCWCCYYYFRVFCKLNNKSNPCWVRLTFPRQINTITRVVVCLDVLWCNGFCFFCFVFICQSERERWE